MIQRWDSSIQCGDITFGIERIAIQEQKRDTITTKNVLGKIIWLSLEPLDMTFRESEIILFISILEAFLGNRLSKIESDKFKIVQKNGKITLDIYHDGKMINLNKLECTYILNCFRAVSREYSVVFSKWDGIEG